MATLNSKLVVSVDDRASAPVRALRGLFGGLRRQSAAMGGVGIGLGGLGVRLAGIGLGYIGITRGMEGTVTAARDQQAALTEIGIKAELTREQLTALQQRMVSLGPSVNQTTDELLAGVDTMLTMGLAARDAEAALPAIAKTSTATGAALSDLAGASVSAIQNLKVAPAEVQKMLEGMTYAGNAGAFEMRDMAQYFPQLTASAQSLGMRGVPAVNDLAAALQIARRGAGDASSAANNLANFTGKIMAPDTIKRFKKFGIDVTKELKKANDKGISPIEHFIKLVDKTTDGGKADLLGQLFGDKQVLDFVRPMLADFKDYIRIRDGSMAANGVVAKAYADRMEDANQKIKSLRVAVGNLGTAIGSELLGPIGGASQYLADVLNSLGERATIFDRLKASVDGFLNGLGVGPTDLKGRLKAIEEFIFGVKDASVAADEIGRNFKTFQDIGKGLSQGGLFSPGSIVAIMGGGLALRTLSGGLKALPFGGSLRLMMLAGGVSALAASGSQMSAVDWAGLAIGLTAFAGGLGKLWPYLGLLSLAGAIANYGPDVAKKARKPKEGEPGWWLGLDPTESREDRLDRLNEERTRSRGGPLSRGRNSDDLQRDNGLDRFLNPLSGPVTTRPSGVQDVKIVNPTRPNLNVTVHMNNTFGAGDAAAAARIGEATGRMVKDHVEALFSDGAN